MILWCANHLLETKQLNNCSYYSWILLINLHTRPGILRVHYIQHHDRPMFSFHTTMTHCMFFTSRRDVSLYESFGVFLAWLESKYVETDCFLLSHMPIGGVIIQADSSHWLDPNRSSRWKELVEWWVLVGMITYETALWNCLNVFCKKTQELFFSDPCWHSFPHWPFLQARFLILQCKLLARLRESLVHDTRGRSILSF